jgi:hypothetical protein
VEEEGRMAESDDVLELSIRFEDASAAPAFYATNLVVQHTPHEFLLHFYDIVPPMLVGTDEEKRKQARALTQIVARPLARVVVAAGRMEEFIKVMQENLNTFKERAGSASGAGVKK